jgi:hypothetical protein
VAKTRNPAESSAAEVARATEALQKERAADDAAQAVADYRAMQEARRANTERLRAIRLAKEAVDRKKKSK